MSDVAAFFFSSRRRHTRCGRDWSSDVCSSDLGNLADVVDAGGDLQRLKLLLGQAHLAAYGPRQRGDALRVPHVEIGRASCRERAYISAVAGALKRKDER